MSDNLDNLLSDIYSSDSQSQGVKELANLINNLSSLLLKAISQLEGRVLKLEQQIGRGGGAPRSGGTPAPPPVQAPTRTPVPMPKTASPFGATTAPVSTPPPPPAPTRTPAPVSTGGGPSSASEAASMLGVTLKAAPTSKEPLPVSNASGPSFLTGTVNPDAVTTNASSGPVSTMGGPPAPDAVAPSTGVAGPGGGFRGELAEKLARRRQKVQQQIEDDFDSPDLAATQDEEEMTDEVVEESTSSELKLDLEDELKNAFSKLKG
ncbi:MAG TPA: hypothetical protein VMX55_05115 [candidate division Zixibacteria bacterium]|nr:hypothetical protein [candidate division Zixibacteria bacterium]